MDWQTWKETFPGGDVWVFGYGSLIWKPPPHYEARIPGYIHGYVRRFWQASTDHRGTPEAPGRVVTVIERKFWETLGDEHAPLEDGESRVWGAAYYIPAAHAKEVIAYLDEREIDGYSAHFTAFFRAGENREGDKTRDHRDPEAQREARVGGEQRTFPCLVYIGLPSNKQFLRDATQRSPDAVARVISTAHGLSGANADYLFELERALVGIGLARADGHVADLARRVRALPRAARGEAGS